MSDGPGGTLSLVLAGEMVAGEGGEVVVTDKHRLTTHATFRAASDAQVDRMVEVAHAAFTAGAPGPRERGEILERAAARVAEMEERFVETMQAEAGFTRSDALGEVRRCRETLRLSAEEARSLTGELIPMEGAPGQSGRLAFTLRVPLGVVLAVTPFNSPLNTVAHKLAPAIAAGNAVILKPASATPGTALLLAEALLGAGLPRGLLSVALGGGAVVRRAMADERVRFIAFTGSTEVGREIQTAAGLRRTQMELGSIAFTVLMDDADLDAALPKVVGAAYRKAGQVCTSVQILLVQRPLMAEVQRRMTDLVAAVRYGDPRDDGVVTGPLISEAEARRVEAWVEEALAAGATRLVGGAREGAVVPPTLIAGATTAMKLGCAEVFGPVLCLEPFDTLDEAVARVNGTPYGLATGIFTNRLGDAFAAARRLHVGGVHINETSSSRVDVMPYGGSKDSGFGREGPRYAVREMTEERVVSIRL